MNRRPHSPLGVSRRIPVAGDGPVAPPPAITGINIDFASANGGESRTITGTNLSSATSLLVDANTATITGNTATTITFTVPASSVDSTNGNGVVSTITVTTAGGTATSAGTPGNSLWYVPAYYGVSKAACWTAQNVTSSSGSGSALLTMPDLSGNGYTLTPYTAGLATYESTGGGGSGNLPYVLLGSGTVGAYALTNASYPAITGSVGEWVIQARLVSKINGANVSLTSLIGTFGQNRANIQCFGANTTPEWSLYIYNGSPNAVDGVSVNHNVDFTVMQYIAASGGSTSQQVLNGGTPATGACGTNSSTGSIWIGGQSAQAGFPGWLYTAVRYPSSSGLGSTGRANWFAYATAHGLG